MVYKQRISVPVRTMQIYRYHVHNYYPSMSPEVRTLSKPEKLYFLLINASQSDTIDAYPVLSNRSKTI